MTHRKSFRISSLQMETAHKIAQILINKFEENSPHYINYLHLNAQIEHLIMSIIKDKINIDNFIMADDTGKQHIFRHYVNTSDYTKISIILKYDDWYVDTQDDEGTSALMISIENKDLRMTKLLLSRGADTDIENIDGDYALFWAIEKEDIHLIQLLLEKGADVNIGGRGRKTPLKIARRRGNHEIIQFLIENGAIDT